MAENTEPQISADSAPEASAPVEATGTTETSAAEKPKKLGILARLRQGDALAERVTQLEAQLETVTAERDAARADLAALEELEENFAAEQAAAAEAKAKAEAEQKAAAEAKAKLEADAAVAAEEAKQKVAAEVADTVAALGVEESALPQAKDDPPGPGQAGEFAHLKGRDRAVAAFNAQFGIS